MIKVTCAIVINKNTVLVTQRGKESDHPLMWEFPGGKIKTGESPEKCIQREIKEELDVEIELFERLESIQFDYGFRRIELIPFLCAIKTNQIKLNEHAKFRWIQLKEIEKVDLLAADKKLIWLPSNFEKLEKYLRE